MLVLLCLTGSDSSPFQWGLSLGRDTRLNFNTKGFLPGGRYDMLLIGVLFMLWYVTHMCVIHVMVCYS